MSTTPPATLPSEVYAVFCSGIDQASVQKIMNGLTTALASKVTNVHLLFQSNGGTVGDGICLYNFFRSLTLDLTIYNVGQVSSIAVLAYLGAKKRKTGAHAMFMLHRTTSPAQGTTAVKLKGIAKSVALDDQRTESILREHINLIDEDWSNLDNYDFYFSGEESVKIGLADEIGEFSPPSGTQIYNL